ncbi:hypothetical protein B0O99DRAFT_645661 [Bisporella sp. PMI_857]|nr:hypothetical protein B0O99DRAFT_645661 [Bisporella sp. PMI_857]
MTTFQKVPLITIWSLQLFTVLGILIYQTLLTVLLTGASQPGFAVIFWVLLLLFTTLVVFFTGFEIRYFRSDEGLHPRTYLLLQWLKLANSMVLWTGFFVRVGVVEAGSRSIGSWVLLLGGDLLCQVPYAIAVVYGMAALRRFEGGSESAPLLTD